MRPNKPKPSTSSDQSSSCRGEPLGPPARSTPPQVLTRNLARLLRPPGASMKQAAPQGFPISVPQPAVPAIPTTVAGTADSTP